MVYLIPEKRGGKGGMAHVIADLPGVQHWLDEYVTEAGVRAEEILMEIRSRPGYDGDRGSTVDIESGDIDRYLVLTTDEGGEKAAGIVAWGKVGILRKAIRGS